MTCIICPVIITIYIGSRTSPNAQEASSSTIKPVTKPDIDRTI